MKTDPLANYRESFRKMIEADNPEVISNISTEHAIVILQELIQSAQKSVYIVSHKLSSDVYKNELLEKIIENKGNTVQFCIATRSDFPESQECFETLEKGNKIRYFKVRKNFEEKLFDYCVVDTKRFRLETDPEERKAIVCAYDTEMGQKLVDLFGTVTEPLVCD